MKRITTLLIIITFSMLLIYSCGEKKQDAPQETIEKQEQAPEITKSDSVGPAVSESVDQFETTTGDAPVQDEPSAKFDFSKNPLKCKIVLLDDLATGNHRKLSKDIAKDLVAQGKILVVKDDSGNIFFLYNEDGTFASKRLAGYCNNNYIIVVGKYKKVNDINTIIVTAMESGD
jgi:hypothetical protein